MTRTQDGYGCVWVVVAVLSGGALWGWWIGEEMKAEYTTARVISDTKKFVESHNGEWPKSWDELGCQDEVRSYVKFDFNVTADELIKDENRIHTSITPVTGRYRTFPHATRNLNALRERLIELRSPTPRTEPSTTSPPPNDTTMKPETDE